MSRHVIRYKTESSHSEGRAFLIHLWGRQHKSQPSILMTYDSTERIIWHTWRDARLSHAKFTCSTNSIAQITVILTTTDNIMALWCHIKEYMWPLKAVVTRNPLAAIKQMVKVRTVIAVWWCLWQLAELSWQRDFLLTKWMALNDFLIWLCVVHVLTKNASLYINYLHCRNNTALKKL